MLEHVTLPRICSRDSLMRKLWLEVLVLCGMGRMKGSCWFLSAEMDKPRFESGKILRKELMQGRRRLSSCGIAILFVRAWFQRTGLIHVLQAWWILYEVLR